MNFKFQFKRQILSGPYMAWIVGFIILPILMILYYGITDSSGSFTLQNITAITEPIHMKALLLSLKLALLCTAICLLLAYPLAMILNGLHLKRQSFVVFIFMLPMWMNLMLRILAWQLLLSNNGILNTVLESLGIDAAKDLGANTLQVFLKIILPLTVSGVISGIIMVFVPALTSFVISDLLGGGKVLLIGNVIEQEFMQSMDWNMGSGLSIVLMVFVIASMAFMNVHGNEEGGAAVW